MKEMNIPLYRAKKINSDEYVTGYFYQPTHFISDGSKIICHRTYETFSIDLTTLAIHFKDTLDIQGNKIFASLREDGKGGDLCETDNGARFGVFIWHKYAMCIDLKCTKVVDWKSEFKELRPQEYKNRTKVIGIKGEYND